MDYNYFKNNGIIYKNYGKNEIFSDEIIDNFILNNFFDSKGNLIRYSLSEKKLNKEVEWYLKHRYKDYDSLREVLFRIQNGIDERPVCKLCGGKVKFHNLKFHTYCSQRCAGQDLEVKEKVIKTNLERIGFPYYAGTKKFMEEVKETVKKKYNVDNVSKLNFVKQKKKDTFIKHYGTDGILGIKEIKEKYNKTCLDRFGETNPTKSKEIREKIKRTNNKRYGFDFYIQTEEYKKRFEEIKDSMVLKMVETKKKNNSFSTSKEEDLIYEILVKKFSNVKRNYKSDDYPFYCDFYIVNEDVYIEYNGLWTHGKHPFNKNCKEDVLLLEKWMSKKGNYYKDAITTWTIRDVNKRETAKKNNLNFFEFWNFDDIYKIIEKIRGSHNDSLRQV